MRGIFLAVFSRSCARFHDAQTSATGGRGARSPRDRAPVARVGRVHVYPERGRPNAIRGCLPRVRRSVVGATWRGGRRASALGWLSAMCCVSRTPDVWQLALALGRYVQRCARTAAELFRQGLALRRQFLNAQEQQARELRRLRAQFQAKSSEVGTRRGGRGEWGSCVEWRSFLAGCTRTHVWARRCPWANAMQMECSGVTLVECDPIPVEGALDCQPLMHVRGVRARKRAAKSITRIIRAEEAEESPEKHSQEEHP